MRTLEQHLARCVRQGGCLIWPGATTGHATTKYPVATIDGKTQLLHRAVFLAHYGWLPEGRKVVIEHTCMRSLCLNWRHLRAATQAQNLLRGKTVNAANAAKTHCVNGHEFTPENTYMKKSQGKRACRACKREWARRARSI